MNEPENELQPVRAFKAGGYVSRFRTMADRTYQFVVGTQELPPEEAARLLSLMDKYGVFLFKETEITEEDERDIPDIVPEFKGEKTPSQRLRAVQSQGATYCRAQRAGAYRQSP